MPDVFLTSSSLWLRAAASGVLFLGVHSRVRFVSQCRLPDFDFVQVLGHIGVAMLVFEGNAVVINIKAETKNKDAYSTILTSSVIMVLIFFVGFATFAYYVFRDETNPIFTLSLYPINGLITFVIICVCFNAFISYPVQILVAFDIIE